MVISSNLLCSGKIGCGVIILGKFMYSTTKLFASGLTTDVSLFLLIQTLFWIEGQHMAVMNRYILLKTRYIMEYKSLLKLKA